MKDNPSVNFRDNPYADEHENYYGHHFPDTI